MRVVRKLVVSSLALLGATAALLLGALVLGVSPAALSPSRAVAGDPATTNADRLVAAGRNVFRFETFGDEAVWGGVLGLHRAIEGAK
jgi:hypothetical protein